MASLRVIFNPQIFYTILFIIAGVMIYARVMDISLKNKVSNLSKNLVVRRLTRDEEVSRRNYQLERIGRGSTGTAKRYRDLIQNVIISLKLTGLSVENFTTLFLFVGLVFWIIAATFFESVIIGLMVAIPSIFAVIALVLSSTKTSVRANDNRVMDSLDLICPSVEHSVVTAIRQNMGAFDPKVRIHFKNFILDIDTRDLSLREAITELNRKLGPRFDEFARKTLIFHDAGDEGMQEIFMDVVEINAFTRAINAKADIIYKETNFNMLGSSAIVLAFLVYTYTNPITGQIMRDTFVGRFFVALALAIVIMAYAMSQITQMSIDYEKIKSD